MTKQEEIAEKILKRMDLIVRLMLKQQETQNKTTLRDQVLELYNFGIGTQDIADILGKTRNSIDIHLTALRKDGKIASKTKDDVLKAEDSPDEEKEQ